ncbi:PucR family transcriptional regulator [Bacillus yapensis]|nr:helix-turn-helix domain-containing protein [Bacillus yapensis]
MLKNLKSLFPTAISTDNPLFATEQGLYWFKEENHFLGIPMSDISEEQLTLLTTLFETVQTNQLHLSGTAKAWHSFLFLEGTLPAITKPVRFIQLQINQKELGVEDAIQEFFHDALSFVWLDENNAIIIEEKADVSLHEDELNSISTTLENDFYIKPKFYIGKFRQEPTVLKEAFQLERQLFGKGRTLLSQERVYTFEKLFPVTLANDLPGDTLTLLEQDVSKILLEDPELLQTLEVFLEYNFNASLAAKKLYVHRNTLQYRLDKFTDRTGISLKSFQNAFTVYLACLLARK